MAQAVPRNGELFAPCPLIPGARHLPPWQDEWVERMRRPQLSSFPLIPVSHPTGVTNMSQWTIIESCDACSCDRCAFRLEADGTVHRLCNDSDLLEMVTAYAETALWSSTD